MSSVCRENLIPKRHLKNVWKGMFNASDRQKPLGTAKKEKSLAFDD